MKDNQKEVTQLSQDLTNFTSNLCQAIQKKQPDANLIWSPYGLYKVLAPICAGAKGETFEEIKNVLAPSIAGSQIAEVTGQIAAHIASLSTQEGASIKTVDAVWHQLGHPFLPEYIAMIEGTLRIAANAADFAEPEKARTTINRWYEENAGIKEFISPGLIDSLTRLVVANVVEVNGRWKLPFEPDQTRLADFHVSEDKTVQVNMMRRMDRFAVAEDEGALAVEVPLRGPFSCLVIGTKKGATLSQLVSSLNADRLTSLITDLSKRYITLCLPKFQASYDLNAKEWLPELGVKTVFSADSADLSGIDGTTGLYMSSCIQKAKLEVNEYGLKATAASVAICRAKGMAPSIVFNRPFILLILDECTRLPLFASLVVNPSIS